MKNRDIYLAALHLLGESADCDCNEDYEERAPYLIAAFCTETARLDLEYRKSHSLPPSEGADCVYLPLGSDFPRCDRLSAAASMYLASMLVIDENSELSDKLFDKYCDALSSVCNELPARVERIVQTYA
ncbi:MAG: hypothetical protein ACI3XQ_05905 [Eubacteriales bacterium]